VLVDFGGLYTLNAAAVAGAGSAGVSTAGVVGGASGFVSVDSMVDIGKIDRGR
jgi:hypothetical protein